MTGSLLLGTIMIAASVSIHTVGLMLVSRLLPTLVSAFRLHQQGGRIAAMMFVVLGIFLILTVEIWFWAGCYVLLGVIPTFESALYFSTTTFSTVGFGDVVLAPGWRLLAALEGIGGFLLIGWSTAYLISAGTRVGPFKIGEHF
ncbi:metal transporter [Aureimonas sp. Leaf454]|uniref:ion channel n=1 Tax=Aureimonas sp. Leaf454 TaxID=1736381 RepID=UPI0006F1FE18|nr:ion channel [Aureimonas sp. Leaf454]KQT50663.1 metal transporter [Aureimonas sp. Leaf454]